MGAARSRCGPDTTRRRSRSSELNTNESPEPPPMLCRGAGRRVARVDLHRYPDREADRAPGGLPSHHRFHAAQFLRNGFERVSMHPARLRRPRPAPRCSTTYALHSHISLLTARPLSPATHDSSSGSDQVKKRRSRDPHTDRPARHLPLLAEQPDSGLETTTRPAVSPSSQDPRFDEPTRSSRMSALTSRLEPRLSSAHVLQDLPWPNSPRLRDPDPLGRACHCPSLPSRHAQTSRGRLALGRTTDAGERAHSHERERVQTLHSFGDPCPPVQLHPVRSSPRADPNVGSRSITPAGPHVSDWLAEAVYGFTTARVRKRPFLSAWSPVAYHQTPSSQCRATGRSGRLCRLALSRSGPDVVKVLGASGR